MFIIGYLIILILRANEVIVPTGVSLIVGVIAFLEALLYTSMFALFVARIITIWRE